MSEVVVVFYRNMNLGHAGSPDRVGLEGALRDAGARLARSFQTNGTVVLEVGAQDPQVPPRCWSARRATSARCSCARWPS